MFLNDTAVPLNNLSEQQLVSCYTDSSNFGCSGGEMDMAIQYVVTNGVTTTALMPYTATNGTCPTPVPAPVDPFPTSMVNVPANSSMELLLAVAQGPVSVAVAASQFVFQFYGGGILNSTVCGTDLGHGITVVGYGQVASGVNTGAYYYIVRNSWGPTWGTAGYINIAAVDGEGICGIQMAASYADYSYVEPPTPPPVVIA